MKIPIDIKTGTVKVESKKKEVIVGIDLGTTNSLVAVISNGIPVVIKDEKGSGALMPSIIHFDEKGNVIVGETAKSKLIEMPGRTIKSVKRLMGKSYQDIKSFTKHEGYKILDTATDELVKIQIDHQFYTPVELSAFILKALKSRAENFLDATIQKAVITVPAYFNDTQRQATRDAGKLAGLDVLRIINEPTAASLAYGLGLKTDESEKVVVYDLGGGTFDVSILMIENGVFEVLSTHGNTELGGDDIDDAITRYWTEKDKDLSAWVNEHEAYRFLRTFAENAKKQLSEMNEVSLPFTDKFLLFLDREVLKNLIQPFVQTTLESCRSALKDAGLSKKDIQKVILVGGSTRSVFIKEALLEFFGITPDDTVDPDEVVAMGAAIQADILAGNRKDIILLDVTPLSLGIETVGGLMDVIIPRNTKIPHKAGRQYTTSVDGQKNLKISVYQGERDLVENNRKLGEFILKNIPPMPAGLPKIDIQFLLDADGILVVKAKELRSNTEARIEINASYGITEEKMAEMLLESIKNASSDAAAKALIESKVEANNVLLNTDKFIVQNRSIMSEDEKNHIILLAGEIKKYLNGTDKNKIELAVKNLNDFASPIAQKVMDKVIQEALTGKTLPE